MKFIATIGFLMMTLAVTAQSRNEISILSNTRALHFAVFQNKDSLALERLFSESVSYGHSSGKVEKRQEAIHNIINNRSTYENLTMSATSVWIAEETAVTRYNMTADERKADGTLNKLSLHILLVWSKEKKDWKLVARQAVRI